VSHAAAAGARAHSVGCALVLGCLGITLVATATAVALTGLHAWLGG
jgi:hypothetical protein